MRRLCCAVPPTAPPRFSRAIPQALSDLPILSWRWKVTQPIESDVDEATEEGEDDPLGLYLRFANEAGETFGAEIIWSNRKYQPGDYKVIG